MEGERPAENDMRIEVQDSEVGMREVKITAFTQQAEIDLAMEYPRILKLLERDWMKDQEGDDRGVCES